MTQSAVAHSRETDSARAGSELGQKIAQGLENATPDVVILFASSAHDYDALIRAVHRACGPRLLVGCSSAGEFAGEAQATGSVSAVALRAPEMQFSAGIGSGLRTDVEQAAMEMVGAFRGTRNARFRYHTALILTDALAGHADDLIEQLTRLTSGEYQFFGGGAGDDGKFSETAVFCGTQVMKDAAVALEILSDKPLGIGVRHGWMPASAPMRVTEADGMRLKSLNAAPAAEMLAEHADATDQRFEHAEPLPFFLQNVLGIDTGGGYKLRVPLGVEADGGILCAADIPTGVTAHIMGTTARSATEAAVAAAEDAVGQIGTLTPSVALFFDCVATRLRTGAAFADELRGVQDVLGPAASFAGCNTYGQVVRVEGQFSGFHNCTAIVCVIPD
ncbi:MAG: FIST C-terminal domain-containing protein [Chloroflexi bacterium]|nr:FIST C-terminal domain-containing protein [Chloroflexota bacterium]